MTHTLRVNLIATGGLYQARCSCRWEGIARYVEDLAHSDARAHSEDAPSDANTPDQSRPFGPEIP